jgi:cytochrome c biogenesis protein CcmG/thiol:disulfide interchange protein DsbE
MMRTVLRFAPLIALALVVIAAAVVLTRGSRPTPGAQGAITAVEPRFDLPALSGDGRVASVALRGEPYLINVFASWCPGCKAEHEVLMQLKAEGVPIVGIAFRDAPDNTRAFLTRLGDPYTQVGVDRTGATLVDLGGTATPETFVVGRDGRVVARHASPLDRATVDSKILPALAEARAAR